MVALPALVCALFMSLPSQGQERVRGDGLVPDSVPVPVPLPPPSSSAALSTEPLDPPLNYTDTPRDTPRDTPAPETWTLTDTALSPPVWGQYNRNTSPSLSPLSWQGLLQHELDSLTNTPMFAVSQLGLYVYDLTDHRELYAVNSLHRMRPASCEKLLTATAALDLLGGSYLFRTEIRLRGSVDGGVLWGDVYVVGGMDPLLSAGDVRNMARELRDAGIDSIAGRLYTDITMKDTASLGWGWCWDDKWGPLRVLSVDGRDIFASELLSALTSAGIGLSSPEVTTALCPSSSSELACACTHTIDQVLLKMMKNSENIFAESLFYQIAAMGGIRGAGHKEAASRIGSFISTRLGLDPSDYQIADGSGLSLYNYVSPLLLARTLIYAWQNENLRTHLYPSLPVAGVDGTLSRRMRGTTAEDNIHAKTGTVEGVNSLAGYAWTASGHVLAFAIINQGMPSASPCRDFQDKVCVALTR